MPPQTLCLLLALSFVASVHSFATFQTQKPTKIRSSVPRLALPYRRLKLAHISKLEETWNPVGQRTHRQLTGHEEDLCVWDYNEAECDASDAGIAEALNTINNTVSNYLSRRIICSLAETREDCDQHECAWFGSSGCGVSSEEYAEFHSVDCLSDVKHIVDTRVGRRQCRIITNGTTCNAAPNCTWENDACAFDVWDYYHGLVTVDGVPEGADEVFSERYDQFNVDLEAAIDAGNISAYSQLLEWTPPPFECPENVTELLCEYVEVFVRRMKLDYYCVNRYDGDRQEDECNADDLCNIERGGEEGSRICLMAPSARQQIFAEADLVLATSINDTEARDYEAQAYLCRTLFEEDTCEREPRCTWLPDFKSCSLNATWLEEQIADTIGYSEDPVCEYFSLDYSFGCTDLSSEDCNADDYCQYNKALKTCEVSLFGEISFAASVTDDLDVLVDTVGACAAAENDVACAEVKTQDK